MIRAGTVNGAVTVSESEVRLLPVSVPQNTSPPAFPKKLLQPTIGSVAPTHTIGSPCTPNAKMLYSMMAPLSSA